MKQENKNLPKQITMENKEVKIPEDAVKIIKSVSSAYETPSGCICQGCNKEYLYDLAIPDEVWKRISPKPVDGYKGGGLLCPECILEKIQELFYYIFKESKRTITSNQDRPTPVRKETHTRQTFAYERGLVWFDKIKFSSKAGNIFSCKATKKWLQARRIYIHYQNEYQRNQLLPLSK